MNRAETLESSRSDGKRSQTSLREARTKAEGARPGRVGRTGGVQDFK